VDTDGRLNLGVTLVKIAPKVIELPIPAPLWVTEAGLLAGMAIAAVPVGNGENIADKIADLLAPLFYDLDENEGPASKPLPEPKPQYGFIHEPQNGEWLDGDGNLRDADGNLIRDKYGRTWKQCKDNERIAHGNKVANPNVLFGHGALDYGAYTPVFTVPDGTSVTVWIEHGNEISTELGMRVNLDLPITLKNFPEAAGAKTYLPGSVMPDYTLYPADDVQKWGNPTTVGAPTRLSVLLKPGMGNVKWSACCKVFPYAE
jgi:hypothetical protein